MTLSGLTYKCSAGETFDIVALSIYGDEKYASELFCANPALCTIQVFCGGELLELPVVDIPDIEEDEEEEDYMPAIAPWKE